MASGNTIDCTVQGLDTLYQRLRELDARVQKKVARRAVMQGAYQIRNRARDNAARLGLDYKGVATRADGTRYPRTGRIPKNIMARARKQRGTVFAAGVAWTTPRAGDKHAARNDPRNAYYGRFVEMGVPARGVAARPHLRPAVQEASGAAIKALSDTMADGIAREKAAMGAPKRGR